MDNWVECSEEGTVFYVNDTLGSIQKVSEGAYVGLVPKVMKLGPFKNLEEAKRVIARAKLDIDKLLEEYNLTLAGK
jgi:hypothetical protein